MEPKYTHTFWNNRTETDTGTETHRIGLVFPIGVSQRKRRKIPLTKEYPTKNGTINLKKKGKLVECKIII